MTQPEFDALIASLNDHADSIVARKRPDYTRENVDVLANFKETAEMAGITPLQCWMVHFYKQFSAIARAVKNPESTPSEPLKDRFADMWNYLQLGWALLREDRRSHELICIKCGHILRNGEVGRTDGLNVYCKACYENK